MSLLSKNALITGSSRGIGREIALSFAFQGATITINYKNNHSAALSLQQEILHLTGTSPSVLQADMSKPEDIASLFDTATQLAGALDIVVSNAGMILHQRLQDTTPETFDEIFNLNIRGAFFVAQQAFKHMNDGGRLIFMSSMAAWQTTFPHHAVYSASKAAVEALVRSLALDFQPKRITVTSIAPSVVKTNMAAEGRRQIVLTRFPDAKDWSEEELKEAADDVYIPTPVLDPVKVAKWVAFVAGDEGAYVNGQVIDLHEGPGLSRSSS